MIEKILDLARAKGLEAEVYYQASQDTPIEFETNRLKSLQTKATEGVALRVIKDGRLGFASSTDLSRLEELVDAAAQTATIGDPVEIEFAQDFQGQTPPSDYQLPTTEKLVGIGEGLIQQVHDYNPEILVGVNFHLRSGQVQCATTAGSHTQRHSKTISASLSGNLVKGEDLLNAYSYEVARDGEPDYGQLVQQLLRKYRRSEHPAAIASGRYPVLFTPQAFNSTIAGLFDTMLSGQVVTQKASPLAGKLGEKLFDERLTLYEDPMGGINRYEFDDEGTPTQKKTLIDGGVVKQFYWDRTWAARAGLSSTGNGFRGGLSRPHPDLVNLCIPGGSTPLADLIAGMDEGIIVDQVLGAGQSNQLAGEFSVNLDLGYKVERGEIVGRVKNTMVAGSIFEAFQNLGDFSQEMVWVYGANALPHALFNQLGVASKA